MSIPLNTVSPMRLRLFQDNYAHRSLLGNELVDALCAVVRTSDYNTAYPGAPLARDQALEALCQLADALRAVYP